MTREPGEIELLITNQRGKSVELRLKPGTYLIGRSRHCQIRLPPENRTISRRHARLDVGERGVRVADLESHSGTMVNGKIISCIFLILF